MKKSFMFFILLIMGVLIVGCSNDTSDSSAPTPTKKVETKTVQKPALVFFFTGVSYGESNSQLVELQKHKKLFSKFPGDIYAVSRASKEKHKQLKNELQLDFKLVSDPELKMMEKVKLVNKNGFAIFDKNGKVIYTEQIYAFGEEAEGIIYFAMQQVDDKK
jgi:peroxiredoxin